MIRRALSLVLLTALVLLGATPAPVLAEPTGAEVSLSVTILSPPSVITRCAWPVLWSWAHLRGELTAMGGAPAVRVYFEWGRTTDYGHTTRPRTLKAPRRFQAIIGGLAPGVTYHFRAVAVVGDNAFYGDDKTLKVRRRGWFWWW